MKVQSINLSAAQILERFSQMEKHFPRHIGKNYFPSLNFYLNYFDNPVNSIKEEADNMLKFIGMGMYTAKVYIKKLDGASGNIQLTSDMYAEITLDEEGYKIVDDVMVTLAHELCHKILYQNGIYFRHFLELENEIYADLATFYVGFGDLTMKGYKIKEKIGGYLTPSTYAMAYHIMNVINGNIDYDYRNLPDHAKREVETAKKKWNLTGLNGITLQNVSSLYMKACSELAELKLLYDNLQSLLDENAEIIKEKFSKINEGFYRFPKDSDFEWYKMSIAYEYINNCDLNDNSYVFKIKELKDKLIISLDLLSEYGLVNKTKESDYKPKLGCPVCKQPISKTLEQKKYHFICPKCKTHIVIDNDNSNLLKSINKTRDKRIKTDDIINNFPSLIKELDKSKKSEENLRKQLNDIEGKWWYKLFKGKN